MSTNEPATLDLGALVAAYLDDARTLARSGPGAVEPPASGRARLRQAAERVRDGREEALVLTNEGYGERTAAMRDVLVQRRQRLEAYARRRRQAVPTSPDAFIVAGRVTDEASGTGLPNVRVRAVDLDRRLHDVLGETRTDALGYYRLEYRAADFDERDQNPETFIEVLDEEGQVLFTSTRSFVQKAGRSAFIPAEVDGQLLPGSLRMADKISRTVTSREEDYARRLRVLDHRAPVTLGATLLVEADATTPLADVRGIGPTFRERLEREGVRDAREVAEMEPTRLAEILEVGEGRAGTIIEEARRTRS